MIRFSAQWHTISLIGPNDFWIFQPQNDITPIELSLSLIPLLTERADLVGGLPPLALRHWRRDTSYQAQRMNAPMPDRALDVPGAGPSSRGPDPIEKLEELAAAGRRLDENWTVVGTPFLAAGEAEFGVCARLRQPPEGQG